MSMTDEEVKQSLIRELTPRQRVVTYLCASLANDLKTGSRDERHTAALLRVLAGAVSRGYQSELVVVCREWAREREE